MDLRRRIAIPETLAGLDLAPCDFPAIAALAASDICAGMNPVHLDAAALEAILQTAA